jgi:hypothetical protein
MNGARETGGRAVSLNRGAELEGIGLAPDTWPVPRPVDQAAIRSS